MKAQIESLLSLLFPVRLPVIDGVIVEAAPHPLAPLHPPLREGEDGCGKAIEHEAPLRYSNGIERHFAQADYEEFCREQEAADLPAKTKRRMNHGDRARGHRSTS